MEKVSESFKKAIKSDTREIKGYVEVVYDDKNVSNYELTISPDRARISLSNEIVDGIRKCKNYASLEENYTTLDGSYLLPNYNIRGEQSGYVSEDIFNNLENVSIKISCEDNFVTSSGITIYFEKNIAQNFKITIEKENNSTEIIEVLNNDRTIYQKIFEQELSIRSLQIDIFEMEYPNRRIRIPEIDLGISQVYEGQDLVSFTTNEEIDLLLTSTPINDCKVSLNNYDNLFDPINPTGIVRLLNDNVTIRPFVGVLTEDNGVEYIPLGYYYLKDWSAESNGSVTLNGQSLMGKLAQLTLKSDGNFLLNNSVYWSSSSLSNYFSNLFGYKFSLDYSRSSYRVFNGFLQKTDLIGYLQTVLSSFLTPTERSIFYISRSNVITFSYLNDNVIDSMSRRELLEDAKCAVKNTIKCVKIIKNQLHNQTSATKEDVLNQTHTLTSREEYVWFIFDKTISTNLEYSFSYTNGGNGTAKLIDKNGKMAYIKFTGNVGDNVAVHLVAYVFSNPTKSEFNISENNKADNVLSLDYSDYLGNIDSRIKENANFYLKCDFPYVFSMNYIGNPSLLPGDKISIETKYGYKNMIITKHSLTFDGSLNGNIEGVGNLI